MSQVITLNTRTTRAREDGRVKGYVCWYWCHHRLHLHIAINLKQKENMSSSRGSSFQNRSLMESRSPGDSCPYHSKSHNPLNSPDPSGGIAVLQDHPAPPVVIIKHHHLRIHTTVSHTPCDQGPSRQISPRPS